MGFSPELFIGETKHEETRMPVSGDIFYFEQEGTALKSTVVLLHGAGGHHLAWPHTIRRISGYRILAPDLPGHGKSGGVGEQSIEDYTQQVLKWLDDIQVYRAVFVGISMGAAIGMWLALNHSERVQGLGLIGAGARMRVNVDLLEKLSSQNTVSKAVDMIVKWSYFREMDQKVLARGRQQMLDIRPSVLHGDFIACEAFDVREEVEKIDKSTCVIVGEEDVMMPKRYAEFLTEKICQAELHVVPEAGHMVVLEKPEETGKILASFLDKFN